MPRARIKIKLWFYSATLMVSTINFFIWYDDIITTNRSEFLRKTLTEVQMTNTIITEQSIYGGQVDFTYKVLHNKITSQALANHYCNFFLKQKEWKADIRYRIDPNAKGFALKNLNGSCQTPPSAPNQEWVLHFCYDKKTHATMYIEEHKTQTQFSIYSSFRTSRYLSQDCI